MCHRHKKNDRMWAMVNRNPQVWEISRSSHVRVWSTTPSVMDVQTSIPRAESWQHGSSWWAAWADVYIHVPPPLCENTHLWEMGFWAGAEVSRTGINRAPRGQKRQNTRSSVQADCSSHSSRWKGCWLKQVSWRNFEGLEGGREGL